MKPAQYEALARETEQLSRTIGYEAHMVPKSEVRDEIGTDVYCGGRVIALIVLGCILPATMPA